MNGTSKGTTDRLIFEGQQLSLTSERTVGSRFNHGKRTKLAVDPDAIDILSTVDLPGVVLEFRELVLDHFKIANVRINLKSTSSIAFNYVGDTVQLVFLLQGICQHTNSKRIFFP